MRCSFLWLLILYLNSVSSQESKKYIFNVELDNYNNAPVFLIEKNTVSYVGNNKEEKEFFSKYIILNFYQTYPSSRVFKSLNMFTFETSNQSLMTDLLIKFPNKYLRIEDLTGQVISLASNYYPNDYGITSPVTNLGANMSLKSFDYVNAPKAWGYFPSNQIGNVPIGISDGKVLNTDEDFINKVSYVNENSFNSSYICNSEAYHGISVGAIAAARGNNAHGITGICPDCTIINARYGNYNYLLDLANAGAKVINMSWGSQYMDDLTYSTGYVSSQQEIINQLHDMGVVLVAAAHNQSSYSAPAPNYHRYAYPASYNHVISVTSVQAKNPNLTDEITHHVFNGVPTDVSWYNEDVVPPTGTYTNGVFSPYLEATTTNSRVDICGPGYAPMYSAYQLNCDPESFYSRYTSQTTPFVTGTVALMQSLNPCLLPDEIEDVLQLCSKNIESNPYNSAYIGKIGSGKLETGDTIEFVNEMKSQNGNAVIDGQDFWRFNFDLQHINNKLTISNQIFRDSNTSNFVTKKSIEVIENSDFKPNENGFVDLKINGNLSVLCSSQTVSVVADRKNTLSEMNLKHIKLFPNPNNGTFTIKFDYEIEKYLVEIYDNLGRKIYELNSNKKEIIVTDLNVPNGLYLVKIYTTDSSETLKFIKND